MLSKSDIRTHDLQIGENLVFIDLPKLLTRVVVQVNVNVELAIRLKTIRDKKKTAKSKNLIVIAILLQICQSHYLHTINNRTVWLGDFGIHGCKMSHVWFF